MAPNPCNSTICKEQIRVVYDKLKEVNHIVRTLTLNIENARVDAERHQHHLKYLTRRILEMGGGPLDESDLENFILEAGEHPVFEVPDNFSAVSSEVSAGCKLTEQSVSSDGMDVEE